VSDFPIIIIPADAREDTEQLGSKPKFWVLLGTQRWLFKEARPGTGEDWAEKVAAEIAKVIGIDAASVELADYEGRRGCVSKSFVDARAGQALVHGNEVLAMQVTGYDKAKTFRQSDHTLENIVGAIRGLFEPDETKAVLAQLAGYMVLDALIGNTDRHHENWGLLLKFGQDSKSSTLGVAPSYDHASSLGRELRDDRRLELLKQERVDWYLKKGRGGIFRNADEAHGENPLHLVQVAARAYPDLFAPALERLRVLSDEAIDKIIDSAPDERASAAAKRFAAAMLRAGRRHLIEILK
jgi:hypothetical protein